MVACAAANVTSGIASLLAVGTAPFVCIMDSLTVSEQNAPCGAYVTSTLGSVIMTAPILVFDSGVGGLSVLAHVRAQLPAHPFVFACDNAALPYGTKPINWLRERIVSVCQAAVHETGACALVVACNTASTVALDDLRQALDIPVIGTVPAVKPAAEQSQSGVIGVLATTTTINGAYLQRLIQQFAAQCEVVNIAADALVGQAERKLRGEVLDDAVLEAMLAPLWAHPLLDTVVLGCTHFPLVKEECERIARAHGRSAIRWLDSGAAIARRTADVLKGRAIEGGDAAASDVASENYSLATAPERPGLEQALAGMGVPPARRLMVELVANA